MTTITETQLTTEQKKTLRYVARLITKGSAGRDQIRGEYFYNEPDHDVKGCCSLGACLIAVGAPETNSLILTDWLLTDTWPMINYPDDAPAWESWNMSFYGAGRVKQPMRLIDVIMQLNDKAEWSFTRIAAYLRLVATKGVVTSIAA